MAVGVGVAMPREMLCTRKHSSTLKPFGIKDGFCRHIIGIFAVRAQPYYGVQRITVDIHDGSEIDIHPYFMTFARHLFTKFIKELFVLYSAEHHIFRETRRVWHTHCQSPFAVEGHCHWHPRHTVGIVGDNGMVLSRTDRAVSPSEMIFSHSFIYCCLSCLYIVGLKHFIDNLSYPFFRRKLVEYGINPLGHFRRIRLRKDCRHFGI